MRRFAFILSSACLCGPGVGGAVHAQSPDPSLWTPASVVNPSGHRPVPMLVYSPASGLLSIDTRGVDRVPNLPGAPGEIGGDDVGMNVLRLTCPPGVFLGQFDNGQVNGITWNSFYSNGQMVCVGSPPHIGGGAAFLNPPANYPFAQLPAGLTAAAFGQVDMSIAFDRMVGAALIGRVQFGSGCGHTPVCAADINCSGGPTPLSVQDIFDFLALYFASDPRADFNGVNGHTVQDIFDFLAAYFAGCG